MERRKHGDALTIACQAWVMSPHTGHGTMTIKLTSWYGRIIPAVMKFEEKGNENTGDS